jgi:hypothetical protein
MMRKLLGLALAVFMTACSSTTTGKLPNLTKMIPPQPEKSPAVNKVLTPEWTALKSGVYHDASGKAVFYGLGSVGKDKDNPDRKILSEDRARDELAKVFTSYMERLVKKLSIEHSDNPLTNINKDQLNNSIEEGTATIMMEAEITNHWLNPDNGKVFSMAKLDLSRLIDKLDGIESISKEDRTFLKNSIVQVHASMTNGMADQVAMVEDSVDVQPKLDRLLSY